MRRIDRPARPAKVDLVNYEPEDAYMFDMRSSLVTCNRERKRERDVFRAASELDSDYIEIMQERGKEKKRERARER